MINTYDNVDRFNVIKCPKCGQEYLPSEIYLPDEFLGKPTYIDKDETSGKIFDFDGTTMNLEESYICDKCNTPFNIEATISFKTFTDEERDFDNDYVTNFTKAKLFLDED